ncbi:MAG TPA: ARMT1-like domain-containing protein [Syntrophorhabdaceae bacterium]|nr:ARMT1-like domain-containing protein [Syntrophorhabdaceae bacterium]
MKTSIDCIPCFVRQTLEATRFVSVYPSVHEGVLREILRCLAGLDLDQSPPVVGQMIHRKLRELTGNPDPYRNAKEHHNRLALEMLPELREQVKNSPDPLKASACLAITGNVVDLGAKHGLTENEVIANITRTLSEPFHIDIERLRKAIDRASSILYLADNAGEIVFDRLLIEELPAGRVTVAVRGGPVINDATVDDARAAGLNEIVRVIDNGSDAPGTILDDCGLEFQRRFNKADLIIAKGQGNYETLSDEKKNIFFLFRIKCGVVASHTGFKMGTNVLTGTSKTPG